MSPSRTPSIDVPVFLSVEVNVTKCAGPVCNAGDYNVTYNGHPTLMIEVPMRDSVIRFGLDAATPEDVLFVGMTTSRKRSDPQLSSYSISVDRRVLVCTDVDSKPGQFDVTLQWIIGKPLAHDPQVHNKPG
ncbi:hypothetical protein ACFOLJ_23960 [Rugamonas sp. CCM 8940]|uniref:hypothetical protein n=1 Tax=Rugamonas sp. CCM 8940 TaxID=2765359 RepID=UPI0018F3B931|nr:hypothetical protein [Rugamonas sp. CCM 8940]MBJ7313511.1 hypothetical protein [Rugamonas sp. CCM 8940]